MQRHLLPPVAKHEHLVSMRIIGQVIRCGDSFQGYIGYGIALKLHLSQHQRGARSMTHPGFMQGSSQTHNITQTHPIQRSINGSKVNLAGHLLAQSKAMIIHG